MKIGILTYHSVPNFGANLQALSTISYLNKKGYDAYIINWVPFDLESMYNNGRIPEKQQKIHEEFCSQNLRMTEICRNDDDIISTIKKHNLSLILIGSDALWHHTKIKKRFSIKKFRFITNSVTSDRKYPNPFWGSFFNENLNIKLAAFSVSSQNMDYHYLNDNMKYEMKKSLDKFSFISLRDEWTGRMVKYIQKKDEDPIITPDPVFSFNDNFGVKYTKEYIINKFKLDENYILLSFRTNKMPFQWIKEFESYSTKKGYTCYALPMPEGLKDYGMSNIIKNPISPLDWYYLIKYSSGYVGERMHPIIVSLHNIVPFYCFDEYGTFEKKMIIKRYINNSSKIYDILKRGDFLDYIHQYHSKNDLPSVSTVFHKLETFDYDKCKMFAKKQQLGFQQTIDKIISSIE